jgi:hypothetical protein
VSSWEDREKVKAEALEIMLKQMQTLQEQTKRAVSLGEGVPAMNISALSREMANLGRVIMDNGRFQKYQG